MAKPTSRTTRNRRRRVIRPERPTDAERALWWTATVPTEADLHRWQVQVTYDVFTRNGVQPHPEDLANHDQLCHIASVILPDAAFDTSEGRSLVEDHEGEVPVTWLFIGGDAWEAAMAKRLAGHGAPHLADRHINPLNLKGPALSVLLGISANAVHRRFRNDAPLVRSGQ